MVPWCMQAATGGYRKNSQTGVKEEEHLGGIEYYLRKDAFSSLRTQPFMGIPPAGWDTPAYALSQFRERKKVCAILAGSASQEIVL